MNVLFYTYFYTQQNILIDLYQQPCLSYTHFNRFDIILQSLNANYNKNNTNIFYFSRIF